MKPIRITTLASALALSLTLGAFHPAPARAEMAASDGRELNGELVILKDSSGNRFRLVGHDGTFAAPSGTSLEEYDGKAVRVTLGRDGRVARIEPQNIAIHGVEHSSETISGQLVVGDAVQRTFTLASDPKVYIAPSYMDIRPYNGRTVQIRLDDQGQVAAIDAVGPAPAAPALMGTGCAYGGQDYSEGSAVCQTGYQYRCEHGTWRNLGSACSSLGGAPCDFDGYDYAEGSGRCVQGVSFLCERGSWRNVGTKCKPDITTASSAQSCLLGGATLANGSFICRDGKTMRCNSGAWVSVGKTCS